MVGAEGSSRVITDLLGRQVNIPYSIKRIVAVGPGCLRLISYMEGQGLLVGVEDIESRRAIGVAPYNLANDGFKGIPVIGPGGPNSALDHERLLSAAPDVIFLTYAPDRSYADGLQKKTGIPVIVLSYGITASFERDTIYRSLRLIGMVIGRMERAERLIRFMEENYAELLRRTGEIPVDNRPSIYVGGISMRGTHGIESSQAHFPPLKAINVQNPVDALSEMSKPLTVDREKLLSWDTDILIIDMGGLDLVLTDYKRNKGFYRLLKAVRERRVYTELPYNSYATNVENALINAWWLGKLAYPDRFKDVDMEAKADEIYMAFLGTKMVQRIKDAGYWLRAVELHE